MTAFASGQLYGVSVLGNGVAFTNPCRDASLATSPKVLGLYRKRSGAMSFEHGAKSEGRSVFDRAT